MKKSHFYKSDNQINEYQNKVREIKMIPYQNGESWKGKKRSQRNNNQNPAVAILDPSGGLRESFSKPSSRGEKVQQYQFHSGGGTRAQTSPGSTRINNVQVQQQYAISSKKGEDMGIFEKRQQRQQQQQQQQYQHQPNQSFGNKKSQKSLSVFSGEGNTSQNSPKGLALKFVRRNISSSSSVSPHSIKSPKSPSEWRKDEQALEPWKQDVKRLKQLFESRDTKRNIEQYTKEIKKIKASQKPTKKSMSLYGINKQLEQYKRRSIIKQPQRLNFKMLNNFIEKYAQKLCLVNKKDKFAQAFASRALAVEGKNTNQDDAQQLSFHNCIDYSQFQSMKEYYESIGIAPSKALKHFRPQNIHKEMAEVKSRYFKEYQAMPKQPNNNKKRKTPPRRKQPDSEDIEMNNMVKDIKATIKRRTQHKQQSLQRILGRSFNYSPGKSSLMNNSSLHNQSKNLVDVKQKREKSQNSKSAAAICKECNKILASNKIHRKEYDYIKQGTVSNFKQIQSAIESKKQGNRSQVVQRVTQVLNMLKLNNKRE